MSPWPGSSPRTSTPHRPSPGTRTELNSSDVSRLLEAQFPELAGARVAPLGEGCDHLAFEVEPGWVFRFPKRAEVEPWLLKEQRILPALAASSPLPLPDYRFLGRPSAGFPWHFGGCRKLPGVPAIDVDPLRPPFEAWVPELAGFLSWLHRFPVHEAARLGVEVRDVASLMEEVRADAREDLPRLREVDPGAPIGTWLAGLEGWAPPAPPSSPPVLVHGDLAAEHVLFEPADSRITGVIDWSDVTIGDRSMDFAALFHWGGDALAQAVLERYDGPVDEATLSRARFLAACRCAADVAFGLDSGQRIFVASGMRSLALSRLPFTSGGSTA